MKGTSKIQVIMLLISVLCSSTSFTYNHPLKLTTSLIEYNPKSKSLDIECRVFMDDFMYSLQTPIYLADLTKDGKKLIEKHFEEYYSIIIDNKKYPFKLVSSEVMEEHNVFIMKFSTDVFSIKNTEQICVHNKLFFKEFEFLQSNKMTIRLPPFIKDNYFDSTFNNYSLTLNL